MDKNSYIQQELETYLKMARYSLTNLRSDLLKTYDHIIKNTKIEEKMYKQAQERFNLETTPVTLEELVAHGVYSVLLDGTLDQAIQAFYELRRLGKKNWVQGVKEEMAGKEKDKNPRLLRKYAESVLEMESLDREYDSNRTIEKIMQGKYEEIEKWRGDTSEPITNYFFTTSKLDRSIAIAYINDIIYEILLMIKNSYDGSIEGFNVKYPTEFSSFPIFNFRNTGIEFEAVWIENELAFLNEYDFENETGDLKGNIKVQYAPEELPVSMNKDNYVQTLKKMNIELKKKELDMRDSELATLLFNEMKADILISPYISMDLRELAKRLFHIKSPKKRHYDELLERLKKLKDYNYTITLSDKESNEIIQTTMISLLSYLRVNFKDNIVEFTPSEQWKTTYVQKKYISLLRNSYDDISSVQTKMLGMILQQERLREFNKGSDSIVLKIQFFKAHMKMLKEPNSAIVKELKKHLKLLQEKSIVVKEYEFIEKNSAVLLKFLPLEERELIAYDYGNIKNREYIDADYRILE